jgi:hypothetical protein
MKNRDFSKGIGGLLLATLLILTLAMTGCENDGLKAGEEVHATPPVIDNPEVTATVTSTGVKLSWAPIIDAAGYIVWRSESGQTGAIQVGNPVLTKEGFYEVYDLVSKNNALKANTAYTYTVIAQAVSNAINIGKWEDSVTTGTLAAEGDKVAAPTAVSLVLDSENNTFTVSITYPTTGIVPLYWNATIYKDGSSTGAYSSTTPGPGETSRTYTTSSSLSDGKYSAVVYASMYQYSSSTGYFANSDNVSSTVDYKALFGGTSTSTPYASLSGPILGTGTASTTITGFRVYISLSSISAKYGVTYKIQRAEVDDAGNPGTYTDIAPLKQSTTGSGYIALAAGDLTPDILGNLPLATVYDEINSTAAIKYRYRVAAQESGKTEYRTSTSLVELNTKYVANASLSVGANTPNGTNSTFSITPSNIYKGALQAGDKLELHYVASSASNAYQNGPYQSGVVFSNTELEAGTAKILTVPANSSYNNLYVQAYLIFADGTRTNISNIYGSGGNVSTGNYYDSNNNWIIYAQITDY